MSDLLDGGAGADTFVEHTYVTLGSISIFEPEDIQDFNALQGDLKLRRR